MADEHPMFEGRPGEDPTEYIEDVETYASEKVGQDTGDKFQSRSDARIQDRVTDRLFAKGLMDEFNELTEECAFENVRETIVACAIRPGKDNEFLEELGQSSQRQGLRTADESLHEIAGRDFHLIRECPYEEPEPGRMAPEERAAQQEQMREELDRKFRELDQRLHSRKEKKTAKPPSIPIRLYEDHTNERMDIGELLRKSRTVTAGSAALERGHTNDTGGWSAVRSMVANTKYRDVAAVDDGMTYLGYIRAESVIVGDSDGQGFAEPEKDDWDDESVDDDEEHDEELMTSLLHTARQVADLAWFERKN
ncbi:hypothetical protein GGR56DRAFT_672560 [Xylariaceae sp. FL0804]|nr:hypothetical protein GGR56DRAFT_672560 [Xylariaceae sp. FL0804]